MALSCFLVVLLSAAAALSPLLLAYAEAGEVGVSYGRMGNNLPDPASVVDLLQQNGITMVRIYDTDPDVLTALADSNIKVMVMLPNQHLAAAAADDQSYAVQWVQDNVAAYPDTLIHAVAVGNEVFESSPNLTPQLVPAMTNIQAALAQLGLADTVKVSTPIAFSAIINSYPPSNGRFQDDIAQSVMKPMLDFLKRTGSCLTVNLFPFFAYANQTNNIPLDYALGNNVNPTPAAVGGNKAVASKYTNLLDAQRDAVNYAMENLGSLGVSLDVTEHGWPSSGQIKHGKHPYGGRRLLGAGGGVVRGNPASIANARASNNNLINRVLSCNTGTPHRPDADMNVYIFALFNENLKGDGPDDVEQNFGLFYPTNMTKVYEFDFQGSS